MSTIVEQGTYDATVYSLDTTDPLLGGSPPSSSAGGAGVLNEAAQNLANRTGWLKAQIAAIVAGDAGLAPLASPTFTGSPAVPDAPPGDKTTLISNTEWVRNVIGGVVTVFVNETSYVLNNGQYGAGILLLTGTLTAATSIVFPTNENARWIVINNTSGADTSGRPWQVQATCATQTAQGVPLPGRLAVECTYAGGNVIPVRGAMQIAPVRSASAVGQVLSSGFTDYSIEATMVAPCQGYILARAKLNLGGVAPALIQFGVSMLGTGNSSADSTAMPQFHEIFQFVAAGQSLTAQIGLTCSTFPAGQTVTATYVLTMQFQPMI